MLLGVPAGAFGQDDPLYYENPTYAWYDNRDPESVRASPSAIAGLQIGFTRVYVTYGRPAARGREIFGSLVPYGEVWRTGADEAPTLTVTGRITFEGHELERGTYALFTIPGEEEWTIIVSRNHNQWGAAYDDADDVVRVTVPAGRARFQERMSFTFEAIDTDRFTAALVLRWARIKVPIRLAEP